MTGLSSHALRLVPRILRGRSVLRRHERWSRAQLEQHQRQALAELLGFARGRSPFYARFHRGLEGRPLVELPVLTKARLMDSFDEVVTDRTLTLDVVQAHLSALRGDELLDGRYWVAATSGSSGRRTIVPSDVRTMNVHLACFTFSFFEELLAEGTERIQAIELVADATWHVYQMWARLTSAVTQVARSKPTALAFAVTKTNDRESKVHLRFPFNAPGYVIETVTAERGIAFNVVHCPVAAYFRAHGAIDLCVASWCNLDFALSELRHQTLVRTKTLVQGADHCDFRVLPAAS